MPATRMYGRLGDLLQDVGNEHGDGGTEVRLGRVVEAPDERVLLEHRLHDPPLDPFPAPVNQPDFAKPGIVRGVDVFLDDRRDLARMEGVEIERAVNRDAEWIVAHSLPSRSSRCRRAR